MKLKAHVLFALADASDPPPIQTDLQLTWPESGQSHHNNNVSVQSSYRYDDCTDDCAGYVAQRYVTRSVALIGCRSVQLHPEAFWSAPVDNATWKSKMNSEVPE